MTPINYFANPGAYNTAFYNTVADAALGVASPFLVQQGITLPGASANGATVTYNNNLAFWVYTSYINPSYTTPAVNTYFIATPAFLSQVWPHNLFPNSVFIPSQENSAVGAFKGTLDCVGFGCRVLAVVGSGTPANNGYCQFHQQVNTSATEIAPLGIVPTALSVAIAWPVLNQGAWSYIAGGLDNTAIQASLGTGKNYTGQSLGGFANAQMGDVLSFGYVGGHSNGHFMVLTAAPQVVTTYPFTGLQDFVTTVYSITVFDSTDFGASLHYNDSRTNNAAVSCGIGTGELYILANAQDEPVGFVFGPNDPAHYLSNLYPSGVAEVVAISVGRYSGN